jgi:hypothetical protein
LQPWRSSSREGNATDGLIAAIAVALALNHVVIGVNGTQHVDIDVSSDCSIRLPKK